jgi:hypothetical protein
VSDDPGGLRIQELLGREHVRDCCTCNAAPIRASLARRPTILNSRVGRDGGGPQEDRPHGGTLPCLGTPIQQPLPFRNFAQRGFAPSRRWAAASTCPAESAGVADVTVEVLQ